MITLKNFFLIPFVVLVALFAVNVSHVWASSDESEDYEEIQDLEDKINELEKKLNELQNKEQSLSREIEEITGQVNLTESRIAYSNAQVARKEQEIEAISTDIENLTNRIGKLEESINYQMQLLNNRTRERYKNLNESPVVLFFGSETFGQLVQKTQYLKIVELQDNKLLTQMSNTKKNYSTQQDLFEQKKNKELELKAQIEVEKNNLVTYKETLASQQAAKKNLLSITQNDEAKYQDLLAEAQRELNQITRAVSVLKNQDAREVEKGEIIGIQGNSGYSSGDHLHFGVYRYSSFEDIEGWDWYYSNYVNPLKKLKKKTVNWNTGCGYDPSGNSSSGEGDWNWPLSSITISQNYGSNTCYNWMYGGKPHPALDMYGPYGSAVYAAEDGDAYFCRNCLGDGGNGVFIFHDDNYMTVYWHLQ